MIAWLDSLITFPSEFEFIKFCVLGVIVVITVCLAFGFFAGSFTAIFNRK